MSPYVKRHVNPGNQGTHSKPNQIPFYKEGVRKSSCNQTFVRRFLNTVLKGTHKICLKRQFKQFRITIQNYSSCLLISKSHILRPRNLKTRTMSTKKDRKGTIPDLGIS